MAASLLELALTRARPDVDEVLAPTGAWALEAVCRGGLTPHAAMCPQPIPGGFCASHTTGSARELED
jgi:hypothetical protein